MSRNRMSRLLFRTLGVSVILLALLIAYIPLDIEAEGEQVVVGADGLITSVNVATGSATVLTITQGTGFSGSFSVPADAKYTEISIPASLTDLDKVFDHSNPAYGLFELSTITKFSVNEANSKYSSDAQGIIYNKDKTTLLKAPLGYSDAINIPGTVTSIAAYAFNGTRAREINIPSSVGTIAANTIKDAKTNNAYTMTVNVPKKDTVFTGNAIIPENLNNKIVIKGEAGSTAEKYVQSFNASKPESAKGTLEFVASNPTYAITLADSRAVKNNPDKIKLEASTPGNYTFKVADSQGTNIKPLMTIPSGASAVYYDLSLVDTADNTKPITNFGNAKITLPIDASWDITKSDNVKVYTISADKKLETLTATPAQASDGVKTVTFTTTHFSEFALVASTTANTGGTTNPNTNTNTGGTNTNTNTGGTNTNTNTNTNTGGSGSGTGSGTNSSTGTRPDMPRTGDDSIGAKQIIVIMMIITGVIFLFLSIPEKKRVRV